MITIYGKENCTFCEQSKKLCESRNLEYEYKMVGADITREDLIEKCPVPVRSVPQIFENEDYVGGFNELQKHILNS